MSFALILDYCWSKQEKNMQSPILTYLQQIHRSVSSLDGGELASYIPELTKADPNWFGISIVTMDGVDYSVGNFDTQFTIQSISKPFVYATALADKGIDFVRQKVGVEPSGDAFNSISLDPQTGAPKNPMINIGAIATTSIVGGATPEAQWAHILDSLSTFAGRSLSLDQSVYESESATGHRNRAIAWMLKNFDIIPGEPMQALENYFRQCSLLVNCRDLAMMAATLANRGVNPVTGAKALSEEHVDRVLSVMTTCGMYDYSGNWLYEVGLPAKSGVGGGIVAVLPGRFGIGIFSPKLDAKGNSVRGIETCKRLSKELKLHVLTPLGDPKMALGRIFSGEVAPSRRQPSSEMNASLIKDAHRIKYLTLHGFLAVDSIEYVVRQMQGLMPDTDYYILDMHQVDGISESGARLLTEARVNFEGDGRSVVFSRIHDRESISEPLARSIRSGDSGYMSFEDNDLAVEWCENRLVGEAAIRGAAISSLGSCGLFDGLAPEIIQEIESVATRKDFTQGDAIITTGESADGKIFVIVDGSVSILVPLPDGGHQRIASLGPGMSFGEMVLLGQKQRSATVFADTLVSCWVLRDEDLRNLSQRTPQIHITLLENLAKDLAVKLLRATKWISALA